MEIGYDREPSTNLQLLPLNSVYRITSLHVISRKTLTLKIEIIQNLAVIIRI